MKIKLNNCNNNQIDERLKDCQDFQEKLTK